MSTRRLHRDSSRHRFGGGPVGGPPLRMAFRDFDFMDWPGEFFIDVLKHLEPNDWKELAQSCDQTHGLWRLRRALVYLRENYPRPTLDSPEDPALVGEAEAGSGSFCSSRPWSPAESEDGSELETVFVESQ